MKRYFALLLMLLAVGLAPNILGLGAQAWAQETEPVVRDVEIKFIGGLETVNRTLIKANIQTVVGKPRSRETIEQDVRNLIATGNFSDVRVLEEPIEGGVKVIFELQGKATIKEITFEGQKQYKEERLRREVSVKVGDILSEQ